MQQLHKQRVSLSVFFFLSGISFSSWASRIPTIKAALNLNEAELGSILLTMPVSSLIGLPISGWLVSKFETRIPLTVAFLLNAICLSFIGFAYSTFTLIMALFLYALSLRIFNIAVNTQAITLQKQYDRKINGAFHGLWSTGGIVGVGVTTLLVSLEVSMIHHLLLVSAATMFWPGSEAEIAGRRPDHWRPFDGAMTPAQRVSDVLAWLDLPPAERPRFITLYLEQYDVAAHAAGTFSPQAEEAMRGIDAALATLLRGLDARGMRATTNVVVLSDHGMADVRTSDTAYLDDVLPEAMFSWSSLGPVAHITPRSGHEAEVARRLVGRHDHYACWNRDALPAAWHYGRSPRVAPIVCQSDTGWRLQLRRHPLPKQALKGEHGFAPEDPQMRAFFVASGPDFVAGAQLPPFDNVDVYPLLAHLLRIPAAPNDGTLDTFTPALTPRTDTAH